MRKQLVIGTFGQDNRRMVCAVSGKAVQSGATATKLDSKHFVYVNPLEVLTDERRAELLQDVKKLTVPPTKTDNKKGDKS